MIIAQIGNNNTVTYATEELVRLLSGMDKSFSPDIRLYDAYDKTVHNVLWVGLCDKVSQSKLDDEILIDVKNDCGIITGANNRSVLIAVYRFCKELGCRFVRPGSLGEIIPERDVKNVFVYVSEKPSSRYRGVIIEGKNRYQHLYDMLHYLPKIGLNVYFRQFFAPRFFYDDCTEKDFFETLRYGRMPEEQMTRIWNRLEMEIEKLDLYYITVGHGWSYAPFGLKTYGWADKSQLPENVKHHFALINGKRESFDGTIAGTQLCLSRPDTRKIVVDAVADYAKTHPLDDCITICVADGANNSCECDECKKKRPSDFFIQMLNEIDARLTQEGLNTRLQFLIYADNFWAPEHTVLNNQSRFLMSLAPTRTHSKRLIDYDHSEEKELTFSLNNNTCFTWGHRPKLGETVYQLKKWKEMFKGETAVFDYHLMWNHYHDPGYYECAKLLHGDVTSLWKLGFSGFLSCQEQRIFFPTNLPMYAMAKGLWNSDSKFEDVSKEYFEAVCGSDAPDVEKYFMSLSALFNLSHYAGDEVVPKQKLIEDLAKARIVVQEFKQNFVAPNADKSEFWRVVAIYNQSLPIYIDFMEAVFKGETQTAKEIGNEYKKFMISHYNDLEAVYDFQLGLIEIDRASNHKFTMFEG